MRLQSLLQPDWNLCETLPELPIEELYKRHLKALILDVDCTLIPHSESRLPYVMESWLRDAKNYFVIHLFSNNPSSYRIGKLGKELGVSFTTSASKPSRKILNKVILEMNLPYQKIALIGDRLFADILTGNQLGLFTVLVKPITIYRQPDSYQQLQRIEHQLSCWIGV
ncbi:MAG TPA: YqeG family HAD IIIA-type phosphatase [Prochlorococcaceae cyanobacterium AMR_MDS_5431]|nr:YqeG family HAD IIIA-type phosphatase [Prochlorococcaceae cyanobacterium AMR_MDS_5431]